ncbi:MAG TPA: hypothetical protein VJB96_03875 [Patescibacteria group bacterium]|nr:hypothetical protein [Patescibacteria group bacterium]
MSKGIKEACVAMVGWGISLFLLVPASKALGSFLPVYIFRGLALLMVGIILYIRKEPYVPKKLSVWTMITMVLIGICDFIAFLSYSWGVSGAYASIVAPISSAYTMVTMLFA